MQTKLKTRLIKDEVYELSFHVKLSSTSSSLITSSSLSCLFSEKAIDYTNKANYKNIQPKLNNKKEVYFNNENWIKVSFVFKANANYEYLTIGNFWKNNETQIKNFKPLRNLKKTEGEVRIMIDAVSLISKKSSPSFN